MPKTLDIPNLDKEAFKKLVIDFDGNLIFSDRHVPERDSHLIQNIFMPLAFGFNYPKEELEKIGMIYEYLDQASPRGVNGYPTFLSFRILNVPDTTRLLAKVLEIRHAREGVLDADEST